VETRSHRGAPPSSPSVATGLRTKGPQNRGKEKLPSSSGARATYTHTVQKAGDAVACVTRQGLSAGPSRHVFLRVKVCKSAISTLSRRKIDPDRSRAALRGWFRDTRPPSRQETFCITDTHSSLNNCTEPKAPRRCTVHMRRVHTFTHTFTPPTHNRGTRLTTASTTF
jgi:hypothetical protein